MEKKFITQKEIYEILPFGKTKIKELLKANVLPTVKVGRDYLTTVELLDKWIKENLGDEIFY